MKKFVFLFTAIMLASLVSAQHELDNEFYFRFGYSSPSWKQFGMEKDDWNDGFKKRGFVGEIGTIFMLKRFGQPENMAIGLDVDYLTFYWHRFSYDRNSLSYDIGTIRFDSKVGPSFTYSPIKRLAIDVFVKADFAWVTGTAAVENDDTDDAEGWANIFSVGISTGFNVRFSILMVGFEFNTISPKLENVDYDDVYLGNANDPDSDRSPLPSVNFTVGLSF